MRLQHIKKPYKPVNEYPLDANIIQMQYLIQQIQFNC